MNTRAQWRIMSEYANTGETLRASSAEKPLHEITGPLSQLQIYENERFARPEVVKIFKKLNLLTEVKHHYGKRSVEFLDTLMGILIEPDVHMVWFWAIAGLKQKRNVAPFVQSINDAQAHAIGLLTGRYVCSYDWVNEPDFWEKAVMEWKPLRATRKQKVIDAITRISTL